MSSDSSQEDGSSSLFQQFFKQFSEEGLAGILILAGIILFIVPLVPLTTFAGIALLILGIVVWFTDWLWG